MSDMISSASLDALIGQIVVLDLRAPYVCIGRLETADALHYGLADADLHDFRDSAVTREIYVYDSVRLGIRRNRKHVWVNRSEVVAMTRFSDISES